MILTLVHNFCFSMKKCENQKILGCRNFATQNKVRNWKILWKEKWRFFFTFLWKRNWSKKLNNFWFESFQIVLSTVFNPKFHCGFRFISTFSYFNPLWEIFSFFPKWSGNFPYDFWVLLEKMKKVSKVEADFS